VTSVAGENGALPYRFADGQLTIAIPQGKRPVVIRIAYDATFPAPPAASAASLDDPTFGIHAAITPRGIFLSPAAAWYPRLAGAAETLRAQVTLPAGYQVMTSGSWLATREVDGRRTTVWEIGEPALELTLSAGQYVVRRAPGTGIPVWTFFSAANDTLAETYLGAATQHLRSYEGLFGPYPFDKFAMVENFLPTGYGFPSYTLLGSSVIRLPFIPHTSLPHEIAHSWWGNSVLVDYSGGNWAEGLTTYVADHLLQERASPAAGQAYRRRILRDYATLVPPSEDFALRAFTTRRSPASQVVGYGRAAMVFHMARTTVGDKPFWEALRTLAREKRFQAANWHDFARALSAAGSVDLGPFIHQWVSRAGAPTLRLAEVTVRNEAGEWRVSGKILQEAPPYSLQLRLRVESDAGERVDTIVSCAGESCPFTLQSCGRPLRVILDPEVDCFRRLDPGEISPTVNGIKGSRTLLAVLAQGVPFPAEEIFREFLDRLGHARTPIVREGDIARGELLGRDVLFLGIPEHRDWLPPLPAGLQLGAQGFTVEQAFYGDPGDALFCALPHPLEASRMLALFLPLSPAAGQTAVPKIPHYGDQSTLVFRRGQNVFQGLSAPGTSPLVWDLADSG
jgi:hypothetical protein